MGDFELRFWSSQPLDQLTFIENGLSRSRREAVFNEIDASPDLPPQAPLRKTG